MSKLSDKKFNLRYYITPIGTLVEVLQNQCGCCPFDLIVTYTNIKTFGKGNSGCMSFENQNQIKKYCNKWRLLK